MPIKISQADIQADSPASTEHKSNLIADFLVARLQEHRSEHKGDEGHVVEPLFVGLQGPQGCGKTTITSHLSQLLSSPPHSLRVATASLDDFYLPHLFLNQVSKRDPGNVLLSGRGLAGTHDLKLGKQVFEGLKNINESKETVKIPTFDKSRYIGKGDRAESVSVDGPIDIFIFEGWSLGFEPLKEEDLKSKYEDEISRSRSRQPITKSEKQQRPLEFIEHPLEHLLTVNSNLSLEAATFYPYFDTFIKFSLDSLDQIYTWRWEQEHSMISKLSSTTRKRDDSFSPSRSRSRGRQPQSLDPKNRAQSSRSRSRLGLSDIENPHVIALQTPLVPNDDYPANTEDHDDNHMERQAMDAGEVREFVKRYLPAYELWEDGVKDGEWAYGKEGSRGWKGRGLELVLGKDREVLKIEKF